MRVAYVEAAAQVASLLELLRRQVLESREGPRTCAPSTSHPKPHSDTRTLGETWPLGCCAGRGGALSAEWRQAIRVFTVRGGEARSLSLRASGGQGVHRAGTARRSCRRRARPAPCRWCHAARRGHCTSSAPTEEMYKPRGAHRAMSQHDPKRQATSMLPGLWLPLCAVLVPA